MAGVKARRTGLLKQHGNYLAHAGEQVFFVEGGGNLACPGGPLLLYIFRHLLHIRRLGSGADGVGKNMDLREAAAADIVQGSGKLLLRFPGKTHDQVRCQGAVGEEAVQQAGRFGEAGGVVPAIHAAQGRIAAGLEGEVEMGAEIFKRRRPAAELLRNGTGLQAAQADTHSPGSGGHRLQKVDEALLPRQVLAPGGDLDAREHHLPIALTGKLLRLPGRLLQG